MSGPGTRVQISPLNPRQKGRDHNAIEVQVGAKELRGKRGSGQRAEVRGHRQTKSGLGARGQRTRVKRSGCQGPGYNGALVQVGNRSGVRGEIGLIPESNGRGPGP